MAVTVGAGGAVTAVLPSLVPRSGAIAVAVDAGGFT
jgi:hypothetical protein